MNTIPKKITPDPIIEAIFDLRFSTNINRNAVFGLISNALSERYNSFEDLPILNMPNEMINKQEGLKYLPHYVSRNDGVLINIGPQVINIICQNNYLGWNKFSDIIYWVVERILDSKLITEFHRAALRYVNGFGHNIFNYINLDIDFKFDNTISNNKHLRFTSIENNLISNVNLLCSESEEGKFESTFDIDTSTYDISDFNDNYRNIIENIHSTEKNLFFSILKKEFVKQNYEVE